MDIIISRSSTNSSSSATRVNSIWIQTGGDTSRNRGYECKTCGKRFHSFQALGGHQGIHKKVDHWINDKNFLSLSIFGPMGLHRCKICMKVFESGPALGGHMTRHRNGKDLVLMDQGDEAVESHDHVMAEAVEARRVIKAEEDDEEKEKRRELILAAKEWRLWPV